MGWRMRLFVWSVWGWLITFVLGLLTVSIPLLFLSFLFAAAMTLLHDESLHDEVDG